MVDSIFTEDIDFITRLKNNFRTSQKDLFLSGFLNPWELSLTRNALHEFKLPIEEWGGFNNAFRKRLVASKSKIKSSAFLITLVDLKPRSMITYSSRKILIVSLQEKGIRQDYLGDIIQARDRYYIAADSSIPDITLHDADISISDGLPDEYIKKPGEDSSTIASARLDSVCAIAFKPSREKLKGLIENGGAMVDYLFANKGGKEVVSGSVISLRGFPRFRISSIGETTKKGRIKVSVQFLE
jgi:RNA-binding protein YlmH